MARLRLGRIAGEDHVRDATVDQCAAGSDALTGRCWSCSPSSSWRGCCSATTRASSPARSTASERQFSLSVAPGRGRDELGDARRARRLAARRLSRRPLWTRARGADRRPAFHHRRAAAGARARRLPARARPAGGRLRRRRGGGRRTALRLGARAGGASRPLRLGLPARHHHRHLPRLSRQRRARQRAIPGGSMLGVSVVPGILLVLVDAADAVELPRWLVQAGRRDEARGGARPRSRRDADAGARLDAIEHTLRRGGRQRLVARGVRPGLAQAAGDRARPRRLPADHRHQRDHLLRQPDFRRGRLFDARGADDGDDLGRRRRQRRRDVHRHRLHRQARPPAAAARRARRHGLSLLAVGFAFLSIESSRPARRAARRRASSRWLRSSSSSSPSPSRSARSCGPSSTRFFPAACAAARWRWRRRSTGARRSSSASSS